MASLADCLKKSKLDEFEKEDLLKKVSSFLNKGFSIEQAHSAAVDDAISDLTDEWNEIVAQVPEKPRLTLKGEQALSKPVAELKRKRKEARRKQATLTTAFEEAKDKGVDGLRLEGEKIGAKEKARFEELTKKPTSKMTLNEFKSIIRTSKPGKYWNIEIPGKYGFKDATIRKGMEGDSEQAAIEKAFKEQIEVEELKYKPEESPFAKQAKEQYSGWARTQKKELTERDYFEVERVNQETNDIEKQRFERGEYVSAWINSNKSDYGEITGISNANKQAKVGNLWYEFGRIYKAERPIEKPKGETAPLSKIIEEVNRKNAPPEKATVTARAWIKNQWKPILSQKEIKRGKNKGKFSVTLTNGKTKIVDADAIRGIQKAETAAEKVAGDAEFSIAVVDNAQKNPRFKEWFGKSKVVDENGEPKIVYSGHSNVVMYGVKFDPKKATAGGFYGTEDPDLASGYATGKLGVKEYYENGNQYRLKNPKTGKYNKKIWQWELTPEQLAKLESLKSEVDEYGDSKYEVSQMDSYIANNKDYDKDARRWFYRGGSKDLMSIWQFYEYMGYNIAYNKDDYNLPITERQVKNGFEELLDKLGIEWQSYDWVQPGVFPVFLKIENPLDTSKPFPKDLLQALDNASKYERNKSSDYISHTRWTKDYPLKEWVKDIKREIESGDAQFWPTQIPKKAIPILKKFGYDGIKDTGGKGGGKKHTVWIALDSCQIKSVFNGKFGAKPGELSLGKKEIGTTVEQLGKDILPIFKRWKNAPPVFIVQHQASLPRDLKSEALQLGIRGRLRGAFWKDNIYLVADNFEDSKDALRCGIHEIKGHYGLKKFLGPKYRQTMKGIFREKRSEIESLVGDRYKHLSLKNKSTRDRAVEEWLAREAETNPDSTWVQKVVAIIKDFLRDIGMDLRWSDADIRVLLSRTSDFVERGPKLQKTKMFSEYQIDQKADIWYSQMTNMLAQKLPGSGSPTQIKQMIQAFVKKGEFKAEELEWSGVEDWLDGQEGKVTKQQVLDYLAENNVRIDEVVKGGETDFTPDWRIFGETKFSQWQLPGGEGYKELLLTLPTPDWYYEGRRDAPSIEAERKLYRSSHWEEPNVLAHARFNERTDTEGSKVLFLEEIQADISQRIRALEKKLKDGSISKLEQKELESLKKITPFRKTSSWSMLVIKRMVRWAAENGFDKIAWTPGIEQVKRYEESFRKAVDEIQWYTRSDYKGEQTKLPEGYTVEQMKDPWPSAKVQQLKNDDGSPGPWQALGPRNEFIGNFDTREGAIERLRPYVVRDKSGMVVVPPHEKWAFTKEEATSFALEKINESEAYKVVVAKKGSERVAVLELDDKGIATKSAWPSDAAGKHISDIIGKRLGERVLNEDKAKVTGSDLTIGGEEMKAFYDQIVVNEVNKFFNKATWGKAKVEVGKLTTEKGIGEDVTPELLEKASNMAFQNNDDIASDWLGKEAKRLRETGDYSAAIFNSNPWPGAQKPPSYYVNEIRAFADKQTEVWSLPITPEMKSKAIGEGMPMFQVSAWHGSLSKHKRFSTDYIGTGEGVAAFGWGIYFSDLEQIAKSYPERLGSVSADPNTWSAEQFRAFQKSVDSFKSNAVKRGYLGSYETDIMDRDIGYWLSGEGGFPNWLMGQPYNINFMDLFKEAGIPAKGRYLYQVTLHKGKKPSEYTWLDWDKTVTLQIWDMVKAQAKKEGLKDIEGVMGNVLNESGEYLYLNLADEFSRKRLGDGYDFDIVEDANAKKEASLFLLRAGIDGIRYPAGSLSGMADTGVKNYVVFDENAVDIESVAEFSIGKKVGDDYIERLRKSPEYKEFRQQVEKYKSTKKLIKSGKGKKLFEEYSKRFGKPYIDDDMKWYNKALENPASLAKRFDGMAKAFNTELNAAETRSQILFEDYEGDLGKLQDDFSKWTKEDQRGLVALTWKWDGIKFPEKEVPTEWANNVGDIEKDITVNPEHYEQIRTYLGKQGIPERVIDSFITIRKTLDNKWIDADKTMRVEIDDPALITEFRSVINKLPNYFPHQRIGDVQMGIFNSEGKIVYSEHFNSVRERWFRRPQNKARQRGLRWIKAQIAQGELKGKPQDYKIDVKKVSKLPDEVFFQIPVEAIQQVASSAGRKLEQARVEYESQRMTDKGLFETLEEAREKVRKQLRKDMEIALSQSIAETFKSRGWAGHAISRRTGKGVPGHETEDLFGILFNYLSGYAGFKTKIERAKQHSKTLMDIDAKTHPEEYRYTSEYVKDMLANQDRTDRAVDAVRGLFFVKYLGFVVKSGFVNLTQNAIMAAPVLSVHTKNAGPRLIKAMKDTRRALTSKAAWTQKTVSYPGLREDEQTLLHDLIERGAGIDQFLRELQGELPGNGWTKHFKKFVRMSGIFMGMAEKFNRASTGLAAYRVAKEKGMEYADALEFAKKIVYESHFVYGKHNIPSGFRGGKLRKYLRSAYTFRSFTHNYLLTMVNLLTQQGRSGKIAFARSLRNVIILGGLTSFPFFKAFTEMLLWVFGKDDEDALTKIRSGLPRDWLKDIVTYGLPGAGGIDLSGSLSIEVPRSWQDLIGVPYAMYEDTRNSFESYKSGKTFRAISELPFVPIAIRNAMRGIELYTEGQTTRGGRDINYPGKVGPKKLTGAEAIRKTVFGLQPTSVSKGYAAYSASERAIEVLQERKKRFTDRMANAIKSGDSDEVDKIKKEIAEYNLRMKEAGKPHMVVDIKEGLKIRFEPGIKSIPKQQRGNALRISEQWK